MFDATNTTVPDKGSVISIGGKTYIVGAGGIQTDAKYYGQAVHDDGNGASSVVNQPSQYFVGFDPSTKTSYKIYADGTTTKI